MRRACSKTAWRPRTPYDLNFRIGDIPVRVHPYFWVPTVVMGLRDLNRPFQEILLELLAWAAILFVSILVHELGHVLMGRQFGSRGHIILTGFCGLAVGSSNQDQRWQRIAVYLAGPAAGFLLAGLTIGLFWLYNPGFTLFVLSQIVPLPFAFEIGINNPPEIVLFILLNMLYVNIFWGLLNLLPIWPLDGGQVCREICEAYRGREGMLLSVQISFFTAIGFAVLALIEWATGKRLIPYVPLGSLFCVIFFGLFAFNSWQLLQFVRRAGPDWNDFEEENREPWEQDADWWKR